MHSGVSASSSQPTESWSANWPVGRGEQQVALAVERHHADRAERLAVDVGHADVEVELGQPVHDLPRGQRLDRHPHLRVLLGQRRGEQRGDGQRGGDRADAQHAGQPAAHAGELVAHRVLLGEDAVRPQQDLLALGREALEPLAALDDLDVELGLELADGGRQRRLGDVAGLGGPAEVPLTRQRAQVLQLAQQHGQEIPAKWPKVKPSVGCRHVLRRVRTRRSRSRRSGRARRARRGGVGAARQHLAPSGSAPTATA